jgi:ribosomal protein S18 acetylase RimI-like enzyme
VDAILTDLTPATLTAAIEDNLFALFRAMAGLPGGELEENEQLIWYSTGLPSAMFNGAGRARGADIELVTGRFRERGDRFFWWTGPQSSPDDLDDRLEAAGLDGVERGAPGMAMALADIDEAAAAPPGVFVQRAAREHDLAQWGQAFCDAHGAPPPAAEAWIEAARRLEFGRTPWTYWLAQLDGELAGLGLSFIGAGVVGLYTIGTMPNARRRGVGSALTLVPMLEAREAGIRAAILHSSPDGALLYPRLGFKEYCRISRFFG